MIPYIDLVNEIMESFVLWNAKKISKRVEAYNDIDDMAVNHSCAPKNVRLDVYDTYLRERVFPMSAFPFNHSVESIRLFCASLGAPRLDILPALKLKHRLMHFHKIEGHTADIILERLEAAEYLGLYEEDLVAITKESFFPFSSFQVDVKVYQKNIGLRAACEYCSYLRW